MGGATPLSPASAPPPKVSIHAPRGGSDTIIILRHFQPISFNPRSPWGERQLARQFCCVVRGVSIHAPRGGSDKFEICLIVGLEPFQSTLPVGGATGFVPPFFRQRQGFNPRSPWGERHRLRLCSNRPRRFNPRSPWGERPQRGRRTMSPRPFQSTLPVGGATFFTQSQRRYLTVSIHAPRGGSDSRTAAPDNQRMAVRVFQSTLPVGGATPSATAVIADAAGFNPRSPWGERHPGGVGHAWFRRVSIHAPRGGSDPRSATVSMSTSTFQSTLPVGGATLSLCTPFLVEKSFNPRSPWGERL